MRHTPGCVGGATSDQAGGALRDNRARMSAPAAPPQEWPTTMARLDPEPIEHIAFSIAA